MTNVLICIILFAITCQSVAQQDSKQVKIVLNSNWANTPVLLEASEFIAEVDEVLFWNFIQKISAIEQYSTLTPKDQYDVVISAAQSLLTPSLSNLLPFSLSLRVYSPKVQMLQQVSSEVFSANSVSSDCVLFMAIGDTVTCDVNKAMNLIESSAVSSSVHSFDHCFSVTTSSTLNIPTIILYGEIGTPQFVSAFNNLWSKIQSSGIRICLRHWVAIEPQERVRLSGYGVQLAVKSTEYKAVDDTKVKEDARQSEEGQPADTQSEDVEGFIFNTLKLRYPDLGSNLDDFHRFLVGNRRELPELKAWQITNLGIQAVDRIMESEDHLKEMRDLSQNLPVLAKSLSLIKVENKLKTDIEYNQRILEPLGIHPGASIMLLNGVLIQEDDFNIYSLLSRIKSQSRMLSSLRELDLPPSSHLDILSVNVHLSHTKYAVDMRSDSVIFINDLEKDPEYSRFSSSVYDFLRPNYPGSLRQIRKNAFNLVFVFDPMSLDGLEVVEYLGLFLLHRSPFRLGVLLVPSGCGIDSNDNDDDERNSLSETFSVVLTYLLKTQERIKTINWVLSFTDSLDKADTDDEILQLNVTLQDVLDSLKDNFHLSKADISSIISEASEYSKAVKESCSFYIAKGFLSTPQGLTNGILLDLENEGIETAIATEVQRQTVEIQQQVFTKNINDHTNFYEYFMSKSNVMERLNRHIINKGSKHIDLSGHYDTVTDDASIALMAVKQVSAFVRDKITYFTSLEGEFDNKALTFWLIADFNSVEGRELAITAIEYTSSHEDVRLGFLHNPSSSEPSDHCALYLEAFLLSQRPKVIHDLIKPILQKGCGSKETFEGVVNSNEKFKKKLFQSELDELTSSVRVISIRNLFIRDILELLPGQRAILSNGKLVGPFDSKETFQEADFKVLYNFETDSHAKAVLEQVQDLVLPNLDPDSDTAEFRSELVMKLSSLRRSEQKEKRIKLPTLKKQSSIINIPCDEDHSVPTMSLVTVIDPLSTAAQKMAPMLMTLVKILPIDLTLILNPPTKLSQMPLKDFYRSVLEPSLSFGPDGTPSSGPSAVFSSLPQSPLFTLNLDVPHSWMVQSVYSPYDLDNIHMASVEREVYGEYQLEYILVEGQCFDDHSDSPTPGLEFVMGTNREPNLYDTIVMANLGYFQLKGRPGSWNLKLRDGRSSDVYQISSYDQYGGSSNSSSDQISIPIVVDSFNGAVLRVGVDKNPGMESENLLRQDDGNGDSQQDGDNEEESFMGSMFGSLFGDSEEEKETKGENLFTVPQNEAINIFSLASGHLYERFLRIMMLSVLKHTENPVKFWFLKNFLSPTFKDFIPKMAQEYGFEYELVQYKWPRWLLAQTEKQRIIWGYKILFLDVLFPLNVKKIIFVDADQIVRTNMKELLEVPLDGAPYGYTPFCDSRKEMDGFRFWNSGYWRNHLGKRAYHISALYVIDLQRFRLLAAGDRLRGQYQMLSQDPNSLANLDQDLPNNMIHNVPIKSLPQEWLWCETWCSNESKPQAKTIDLCNNPLTKEPKLTSAMRIVPEWKDYDNEIKKLQEQFSVSQQQDNQEHSHSEL